MDLKEFMEKKNWVVLGNTTAPEKYACRIKEGLIEKGFNVSAVGKELVSIDEVPYEIDVVDLCIHPVKGLDLLSSAEKRIGAVLIQPGAGSEEIKALLDRKGIPWLEGCALIGMREYC